jgi:UTP-glucose-1-phosphate uridylyltransferase
MTKPTLLILAAGMGSRYGSLKQMDAFGPNGEAIIDYSIYDAIEAGFGKIVFIIRENFRAAFEEAFLGKFDDKVEIAFVTQELDKIPSGFAVHPNRTKPWGTAHAVWVGHEVIDEPFGVINADDFYGRDAYKALANFLNNAQSSDNQDYAVISYRLGNTLSDHGTVNRGICHQDESGNLLDIVEAIKIENKGDHAVFLNEAGKEERLELDTLVSMNMFGFLPTFFDYASSQFEEFLKERGMEEKSEFFIPLLIDKLIKNKVLNVKIIDTDASWFGVTYKEDKPVVQEKLNQLIAEGVYPEKLWK